MKHNTILLHALNYYFATKDDFDCEMRNTMVRLSYSSTRLVVLLIALVVAVGPTNDFRAIAQNGTGFLDFENGVDEAVIGDTIPGVNFSNTQGFAWKYGDVRTRQYNAPYPQDCPNFGGQCAYTLNGNLFAWMGPVQGQGRIDFTLGTASFFEAKFSTADILTIEAYDSTNQRISSQSLSPNIRTGRLDTVTLTALSGTRLAYVLISGTQNRWLMDDLRTDAPIVPPDSPPNGRDPNINPAFITVVQRPDPNTALVRNAIVTYTIVATNRGDGRAKNAVITVPFDPAEVRVVDATFSREGAWVSKLVTNTLEIETGPIGSKGDVVTTTLRFAALGAVADATSLAERLTFSWSDFVSGGTGRSNQTLLAIGPSNTNRPFYDLAAAPVSGPAGSTHSFSSPIFVPKEPVTLWYNTPDNKVVAVGTVRADEDGAIKADFTTSGLAKGTYSMVARGNWSEFTAVGVFVVQ